MPLRRVTAQIGPALFVVGAWLAMPAARAEANDAAVSALKQLSIEELLNTDVTSVSKSAEPLSDAAAAVFVITREDILNSGARSLPEILRLAPNLQVDSILPPSYIRRQTPGQHITAITPAGVSAT